MYKYLGLLLLVLVSTKIQAQDWETPVIEGYGKIKNFKEVAVQPDSTLQYNLVFDLKDGKEKDGVNVGLFKIARTLNMLGAAGVPSNKVNIVAAIHGEATFIVLNEEKYQEKYGEANPNIELMALLKKHDVELFVCAQATASRKIENSDINDFVTPALSALSVLSNYQLQGYVFMP